jgi:CubicO group peptidase (beta-lactamase class C family)
MKPQVHLLVLGCLLSLQVPQMRAQADVPRSTSLADAAQSVLSKLKGGGCIVTGELREGKAAFGLAGETPAGTAAPEDILFEIGSISKTFTGLLLAQAVVEGKVTLETTVKSLLGQGVEFADPRVGNITLVQLSTHTSGLPRLPDNHAAGVREGDPYAAYTGDLLLHFLTTTKLKGEPPFRASYSNAGTGLLGFLLARVYGKSWEDLVLEKICQPLGLKHTRVNVGSLKLPMAPPGAGKTRQRNWTFDALAGAGALRSTAADLIHYGRAVLRPHDTPLSQAFALALKPHADFGPAGARMGLGFFIREVDGATVYSHDGGTGGYASLFRAVPATGLVQVVLINNNVMHGSEVIAATHPRPGNAKGSRQWPAQISLPPQALKLFAGVYDIDQDSRFTILYQESENQLWARLTGQPFFRLFPRSPERFFLKVVEAEIEFTKEADRVIGLTLFQNGAEVKAVRTDKAIPPIQLKTAAELKPYTGTYKLLGMQDLVITQRAETLFAKLADQPAVPVFATTSTDASDRFEYDVVEAALVFTRDNASSINGLVLHQNGAALPAPRVAAKESADEKAPSKAEGADAPAVK